MNTILNSRWFWQLLAQHQPPCVSIYLPLHRAEPPAAENPRRFRNQLDKMQDSLRTRYDERVIREMTERVESLVGGGQEFWTGDRDAIAIFASPDHLQLIDLLQPVDPQVVVADSFHVKPLIRVMQAADRYQLLCLELKRIRMFEGNRWRLDELDASRIPQTPSDVAGMRLSRSVDSASDLAAASLQANEGNGSTEPAPTEQFFRAVDKAVWENYSRLSRLPLILVAIEQHHPLFRSITRNQYLMKEGIKLDPHRLPVERMRQEAWKLMEPIYQARLQKLKDDFCAAKAHQRGSDDPIQVAEAASAGRIGTLLVAEDKQIPARIARESGLVLQSPLKDAASDDMLDDLAEMVLRMDGQVLVVPPGAMPTQTGVAAIYRY